MTRVLCVVMLGGLLCGATPQQAGRVVPCPDVPSQPCMIVQGRYVRVAKETPPPPPLPPFMCLEDEDTKVCGYQCLKNYGQMKCAATPQGVCGSVEGKVVCWDPPAAFVAFQAGVVPAPRCVANYGQIACGYNCVEHDGKVACSDTPMGRCAGNFGKVVCFDPPLSLLPFFQAGSFPQAQCLDDFGKIACGYHCLAQFGQVKCAVTPQGACTTKRNNVLCFDPPTSEILYSSNLASPSLAEASCLTEGDRVACGYNCLANDGDVACAGTPRGKCVVGSEGRVECADPSAP